MASQRFSHRSKRICSKILPLAFRCCPCSGPAERWVTMKNKGNNHCDGCGGSVRALAASAGIQFGDLQAEAYRLREKLGPDHQKAYYEIIRQLALGGAVSETEQRTLLELGKRGFGVGSDREAEKFVAYAQGLHKRMLADRGASPVALAIVGVIANYAIPSHFARKPRTSLPRGPSRRRK